MRLWRNALAPALKLCAARGRTVPQLFCKTGKSYSPVTVQDEDVLHPRVVHLPIHVNPAKSSWCIVRTTPGCSEIIESCITRTQHTATTLTYAPILNYLVVVHACDWQLELSWSRQASSQPPTTSAVVQLRPSHETITRAPRSLRPFLSHFQLSFRHSLVELNIGF